MRIEGSLTKWNDDRGFGFIAPTAGGSEIFVHISAFPKDGKRPTLGEYLSFEIEIDKEGKKRAVKLLCHSRSAPRLARQAEIYPVRRKKKMMERSILIAMVITLGAYGYGKYTHSVFIHTEQTSSVEPHLVELEKGDTHSAQVSSFNCDGRTQCSQMNSCDEALFFLQNCPNVQMDGDHDGVPCEQQWCH